MIAQWTMTQAQLATLTFPQIGSICHITESGEPVIGKLSTAASEGLDPQGPFSTVAEYFTAIGEAALRKETTLYGGNSSRFRKLGALVFIDIVEHEALQRATGTLSPQPHGSRHAEHYRR